MKMQAGIEEILNTKQQQFYSKKIVVFVTEVNVINNTNNVTRIRYFISISRY